jgi:hypothetical protein
MRTLARLLLIIPLALIIAIGAGGFFLMLATVVSPALAQMVFAAMNAFADTVFGLAFNGEDPSDLAIAASWQGFKLMAAILIMPVVITAIVSELFRVGSGLFQMTLSGVLASALPAAIIGLNRLPTSTETRVLAAFFLTGVVTGAVYWVIAGRGAAEAVTLPKTASGPGPATR